MRRGARVAAALARGVRRGFTVVELLMVVILVGLLASVALPNLSQAKEKAYRAAAVGDLRTFASAQEAWHDTHGRYGGLADMQNGPPEAGGGFRWSKGVTALAVVATATGWSAEIATPSGTRCALAIGTAALPTSVPGLVPGIPACEP